MRGGDYFVRESNQVEIIAILAKFFEENMGKTATNKRYWATWLLIFIIAAMFGSAALINAAAQLLQALS